MTITGWLRISGIRRVRISGTHKKHLIAGPAEQESGADWRELAGFPPLWISSHDNYVWNSYLRNTKELRACPKRPSTSDQSFLVNCLTVPGSYSAREVKVWMPNS